MKKALFPHKLNRMQYFLRGLVVLIVLIGVFMTLWVAALVPYWFFLVWTITVEIYAAIGVCAPRLRDAGHPPVFAILTIIPTLNAILAIVLLCLPSKKQPVTLTGAEATAKAT